MSLLKHNIGIIILFFMLFLSCTEKDIYSSFHTFRNAAWHQDSICTFDIVVTDTLIKQDIFVELRNNNEYPFSNLWLFVTFETPYGNIRQDTLNCILADDYGQWYGKGFSLYQMSFPYEKSVIFPESGIYSFKIRHGMRDFILKGINDVGIVIRQSN